MSPIKQEVNSYIIKNKLDKQPLDVSKKIVQEDKNIGDQFKEAIIEELIYQAKSLIGKIFHWIGGLF